MIKAVCLDWDDTCIYSWGPGSDYILEVAKLANIRVPEKGEIKPMWGHSYEDVVKYLWPDVEDYDKFMNLSRTYPVELVHPPVDGIHQILEKLADNYVLCVLTQREIETLPRTASDADIDLSLFYKIITKNDLKQRKPNPEVFDPLINDMKSLGINKDEILYVDDSILGFQASRDAGLNFYAVTTGVKSKEDFIEAGLEEERILDSIAELPDKLNGF